MRPRRAFIPAQGSRFVDNWDSVIAFSKPWTLVVWPLRHQPETD